MLSNVRNGAPPREKLVYWHASMQRLFCLFSQQPKTQSPHGVTCVHINIGSKRMQLSCDADGDESYSCWNAPRDTDLTAFWNQPRDGEWHNEHLHNWGVKCYERDRGVWRKAGLEKMARSHHAKNKITNSFSICYPFEILYE